MVRVLMIGIAEKAAIAKAIERAWANPVPLAMVEKNAFPNQQAKVVTLKDRKDKGRPPSQFVEIPNGYVAAISFEQQPAGLVRHLSISIDRVGMVPNEHAVQMIAEAFGFVGDISTEMMWMEEFEPDHHAINIVQLADMKDTKH